MTTTRQRTARIACFSLVLTAASSLSAQTGAPGGALPGLVVQIQSPEAAAECEVPTLEECQDLEFLEDRGCGAVQNSPDATCMTLFLAEVGEHEPEIDIVPKKFSPSGVGEVVKHPPDAPSTKVYQPDLYSFASKTAARDLGFSDEIAVNLYAMWRNNGAQVTSCEEYVYEKYFDVNEFLRVAGPERAAVGKMVDVAFGSANDRSSIGTRHLGDARLRGYDGRVFGKTIQGTIRQKNRYFAMKNYPSLNSEGFGINGAPPLLDSLSKRSLQGAALLAKIAASRLSGSTVQETWAWHKSMKETLRANPNAPAFLGPNQIVNNNGPQVQQGFNIAALGTTGGAMPIRRRLDKELDELYRQQLRVDELQAAWSRADVRFQGSGWTVQNSGLALPVQLGLSPNGVFMANGIAPKQNTPMLKVSPPNNTPLVGGQLAIESPETVIRRAILDELLMLLIDADKEGCLDAGLTACDWSPQYFAERAGLRLNESQDRAYAFCNNLTSGNLQNVVNVSVPFVTDPAYPQFQCTVTTGSTITAQQLEKLESDVEHCREQQVAYLEAKAADEARNRVRQIPELIDEATGAFKFPGGRKSKDELMGNDKLGLNYAYDFGFLIDAEEEICKITVDVGGDLYSAVKAFSHEIVLLDARAWASTVTRDIDVYTRVIDKSIFIPKDLFTPIHVSAGPVEPIEFNVAKTPQISKDLKIIETIFVVVVVPISIEVGVSGRLGVKLGINGLIMPPNNEECPYVTVEGLVEPFLGVDAYLAAAIDIFIAEAGVRGEVNVITVSVPFRPGVTVRQLGGLPVPANFEIEIGARLDVALSTLSGRIQAYAEIGFCPFCADVERTIIEWQGPRWEQNIFTQTYIVNLGDLGAALFP
jgi:hypothetical protein